jgi:hypothetical protein
VILGICVLVWPGISILVAATLFGVYLLITGIAQVIFAFALDVSAGARILLFISGAASLILAVLLLAIWIGVGLIFRGTATLVAAISERGLPGRGWLIFYGVISLIAGVVVLAWPFDSIVVLAITIGGVAGNHGRVRDRVRVRDPQRRQQDREFPPAVRQADPQGQQGRSTALTRHQPAHTMPPRHRLTSCIGSNTS